MLQVVLFAAAVILLWLVWVAPQTGGEDLHEPFAPLSGASAWPSQLLRTLAIVLFAWFLDFAWCKAAQEADAIGDRYFPVKADASTRPAATLPRVPRTLVALRDATIWLWQPDVTVPEAPGAIDGTRLWREYRRGLLSWPRLRRIGLWLLISTAVRNEFRMITTSGSSVKPAKASRMA